MTTVNGIKNYGCITCVLNKIASENLPFQVCLDSYVIPRKHLKQLYFDTAI